ncbi:MULTISPECIES: hypothetical protein [Priestia]|uniref:hypothetical protein n=1 Tax=Priestia TaxID=2800373 RepID=UPI00064F3B5F|nr:hypothetical protein [Priestia aryabhattai]KML23300.1 hypothetical protein VL11_27025 [Priestia aryabhattai]KMN98941.1 hypothetical protein ABV89_14730 [Priestia aryabhattai]
MKRSIKTLYLVIMLVLIGSVSLGIIIKKSFINDVHIDNISKKFEESNVSISEEDEFTKTYFQNNITNLKDLINKSDLIIKGTVNTNRKMLNQSILTEIQIQDIYKNDSNQKLKDSLYIFEPTYFNFDTYIVQSGYNIMKTKNQYVLFLKRIKVPDNYKYKGKEEITYVPVSTYYGKYPTNNKKITKLISNNEKDNSTLTYHQIEDYEVLTSNEQILNKFLEIKHDVKQNFK